MTDHWDWLQTAATGEWKIYVGQDDGLLEEFFEIAHECQRSLKTGPRTLFEK
jgi:hypothetical protein